jgi:hypothetical protein
MELATSVAADLDCNVLNGEAPLSPAKEAEPVTLEQETEDGAVKVESEAAADLGKTATAGIDVVFDVIMNLVFNHTFSRLRSFAQRIPSQNQLLH